MVACGTALVVSALSLGLVAGLLLAHQAPQIAMIEPAAPAPAIASPDAAPHAPTLAEPAIAATAQAQDGGVPASDAAAPAVGAVRPAVQDASFPDAAEPGVALALSALRPDAYMVQAASFRDPARAARLAEQIATVAPPAGVDMRDDGSGAPLAVVMAGPFSDAAAATSAAGAVARAFGLDPIIRPIPQPSSEASQ